MEHVIFKWIVKNRTRYDLFLEEAHQSYLAMSKDDIEFHNYNGLAAKLKTHFERAIDSLEGDSIQKHCVEFIVGRADWNRLASMLICVVASSLEASDA